MIINDQSMIINDQSMIINDPHVEMIWILKWRLVHACIYELACWPSLMFRRLIQRMHPLLSAEARNAKTNDTQVVLFGGNEQAEPAALIHSVNCSFWNSTAFALHSSFCFVSINTQGGNSKDNQMISPARISP